MTGFWSPVTGYALHCYVIACQGKCLNEEEPSLGSTRKYNVHHLASQKHKEINENHVSTKYWFRGERDGSDRKAYKNLTDVNQQD